MPCVHLVIELGDCRVPVFGHNESINILLSRAAIFSLLKYGNCLTDSQIHRQVFKYNVLANKNH